MGPLLPLNCQLGQLTHPHRAGLAVKFAHYSLPFSALFPQELVFLQAILRQNVVLVVSCLLMLTATDKAHKCEREVVNATSGSTFGCFWRRFFSCRVSTSPQCISLRFQCFAVSLSLSLSASISRMSNNCLYSRATGAMGKFGTNYCGQLEMFLFLLN